jgi:hypothetical protein
MLVITFVPKPAGLGDILLQINAFTRLISAAGGIKEEIRVILPKNKSCRISEDYTVEELLTGVQPEWRAELRRGLAVSFDSFLQYVLKNNSLCGLAGHLVIRVNGASRAIYDMDRFLSETKACRLDPKPVNNCWLLSKGRLWREAASAVQAASSDVSLLLHARLGDCAVIELDNISNQAIRRHLASVLHESSTKSWIHKVLSKNNISSRGFSSIHYREALESVLRGIDLGERDIKSFTVISDGSRALADRLLSELDGFNLITDIKELSIELDAAYFSVFDAFKPAYVIGDGTANLFKSVRSILAANIIITGSSTFPEAIRYSYGRGDTTIYKIRGSKHLVDKAGFLLDGPVNCLSLS